jgi:hypothetical protein
LQREANAIDTNKYDSITKLTRVKMLLSIAQQNQAATAKSFVARQRQQQQQQQWQQQQQFVITSFG